LELSHKNLEVNKSIKELGELKLVGFRVICEPEQFINEIPKAANTLHARTTEIKHVIRPEKQIGAFVVDVSSENDDGYWVCVEVEKYEQVPRGMVTLTVPPQKYAVITHQGPNDEIMNIYEELHQWIKENHFVRQLNKWHIEVFHDFRDKDQVVVELFDTIR
jgi:predicted transcriptional regulator YdeE